MVGGLSGIPSSGKILMNYCRGPATAWGSKVLNVQAEPESAGFVQPGAEAAGAVFVILWVVMQKRDYGSSWRDTDDQGQTHVTTGKILTR